MSPSVSPALIFIFPLNWCVENSFCVSECLVERVCTFAYRSYAVSINHIETRTAKKGKRKKQKKEINIKCHRLWYNHMKTRFLCSCLRLSMRLIFKLCGVLTCEKGGLKASIEHQHTHTHTRTPYSVQRTHWYDDDDNDVEESKRSTFATNNNDGVSFNVYLIYTFFCSFLFVCCVSQNRTATSNLW